MGSANLDQFIAQVQQLSANGSHSQLAACVRRAAAADGILSKNTEYLDNALQTLDLQQHSAAIAAIIVAKLAALSSNNANDLAVIRAQVTEFAAGCNGEQIRLVPDVYCALFEKLAELLLQKNESHLGIELLATAIRRLRVTSTQLTPIHAQLCCLCLKARILKPALEFLEQNIDDILFVSAQQPHFDSAAFLSYYYYGGMIYAALQNWDRSLFYFEVVLTTPAVAVSQIMVEAYRKHILVSLIVYGKLTPLPSYRSTVITRNVKPLCQEYTELADIVSPLWTRSSGISTTLQLANAHMRNHRNQFKKDNNFGLVKQVMDSIVRASILRLTNTFITLSLADVANRCHLTGGAAEAEQYLLAMIKGNVINAKIDQENGMVTFKDRSLSAQDAQEMVPQSIEECIRMEAKLRQLDTDTLLNPQFISRVTRATGGGPSPSFLHDDEGLSSGVPVGAIGL